jgi:glutamine cyclotransferase
MKKLSSIVLLLLLFSACKNKPGENVTEDNSNPPPPFINFSIVKVYPHDTSSYTQGLQWVNNMLYEGTGRPGFSKLAEVNLQDGKAVKEVKINPNEFGEGITLLNNKIYQLTWQNNVVHVYDAVTFKKIKDISWPYEGWGLTTNGKELIVSTGSSNLYFVDPETFKILKQVSVIDNYGPVALLNELEYVKGFIYANQYETNYILKIDPESGKVVGKIDCDTLLQKSGLPYDPGYYTLNSGNVLNGIAYDSAKNSLYITGKLWPALFEIKLDN